MNFPSNVSSLLSNNKLSEEETKAQGTSKQSLLATAKAKTDKASQTAFASKSDQELIVQMVKYAVTGAIVPFQLARNRPFLSLVDGRYTKTGRRFVLATWPVSVSMLALSVNELVRRRNSKKLPIGYQSLVDSLRSRH